MIGLYRRIGALENVVEELRQLTDSLYFRLEDRGTGPQPEVREAPVPAPPPPPVERQPVSVPAVALNRSEVLVVGPKGEPEEAEDPAPTISRFSLSSLDFEEVFGRRLPIWAGGVALAVAGVFLVRYSIEAGLLTPPVRVAMAFLFGGLLLGGAELAYRQEERIADPRVRQALAGAGLATLYAGFYLAGSRYGLIGQSFAFLGLAAVTGAAIALSFRFGLPSAVLGLVGGFAAPALVGGDEANLPLLSIYLGLVTAGLTLTGQRQERSWLGIAALVGGLGWGALLILSGDMGVAGLLALGLYIVALGTVLPALTGTTLYERPVRLAAALAASAQLALLVHQGGYSPLAWSLYVLLAGALAWFGWRKPELRDANAAAAVIGVLLYAQWGSPPPVQFALVGGALAAVFAGAALALVGRGESRRIDLAVLALTPPALATVAYTTFGKPGDDAIEEALALATFALAALPFAGAWNLRGSDNRTWIAGLLGSGTALIFAALLMLTPGWSAPIAALVALSGPAWLAHARRDTPLLTLLWTGAVVTLLTATVTPHFEGELIRLGDLKSDAPVLHAVLRWIAMALPVAGLAVIEARIPQRRIAEGLAATIAYGALAQFVPAAWLAWTGALLALAVWRVQPARVAAQAAFAGIALLWALEPMAQWLAPNTASLAAIPVKIGQLPSLRDVGQRVLPLLACCLLLPLPLVKEAAVRRGWLVTPLVLIAVHTAYKQAFAIETTTAFVDYGVAERTIWEALVLVAAWFADRGIPRLGRDRSIAIALAGAALAHFLVYTAGLHNPLWDRQAVGPTPLANWILAAHAVGIGAVVMLRGWLEPKWRPALDGLVMAVASLGAISLLRQAFAGAVLVDEPLGQTEDLLRSLMGIVLALFFLWLGSRLQERSWRIGSLVLMLVAVAKVFLLDAAELEGLLRIASFMALGFSLIGIGWVYSRQLRGDQPAP